MINIYEYLLGKSKKIVNVFDPISSKKYDKAIQAGEIIYNEMKDVIPKLNDDWKNYLNNTFRKTFENEKEYDKFYKDLCLTKLSKFNGYSGSDNEGLYFKFYSAWKSKNIDIDFFSSAKKEKLSILFSTCCDILENYGWGDPMFEWSVKDFRMAYLGMEIAFRIIIYEKQ